MMSKAKILIFDIETSPNLAYVWGKWKQNVHDGQFVDKSYIMSFAAKWLGDDEVFYFDNRHNNDKQIVKELYKLFDEADIIVAHNGKRFDIPRVLGRGLVHGLTPPSPYHTVDTLLVARRKFGFLSNTLANLCEELKLPLKGKHKKFAGFDLWVQCLKQNDAAWDEMEEYNRQDILSLEALYFRLLPYIDNHPNVSRMQGEEVCQCTNCGSESLQMRGKYHSKAGLSYQRFVCTDCHSWGRFKLSDKDAGQNKMRAAFNG